MDKKILSIITGILFLALTLSIVSASTSYYNWRYTGNNEPDTSSFVSNHLGYSSASSSSSTYSSANSKSNTMFQGSFNSYRQAQQDYYSQSHYSNPVSGPFQGGLDYPLSYLNYGYSGYGYESSYYGGYDSYYGGFNGGYGSYFGSYW